MQSSSQIITINKPTSSCFTGWMPFLSPNQQRQSTEWNAFCNLSHKNQDIPFYHQHSVQAVFTTSSHTTCKLLRRWWRTDAHHATCLLPSLLLHVPTNSIVRQNFVTSAKEWPIDWHKSHTVSVNK